MKKVAIITLNGYNNYGNRLQNYALQEVIKELGYDVETILHHELTPTSNKNKIIRIAKRIIELRKMKVNQIKRKINNVIHKDKINAVKQERIAEFKIFSNNYINETSYTISNNNLPNSLASQYNFFVAGSDQIWNPYYQFYEEIIPAIEYLTFAPEEKRLSYAASFGINAIPENFKQRVVNGLNGMKSILVREQSGVEIVEELTGRKAQLVLDPTMLLTKEKWLSIADANKNKPSKKYLLTYFLGELSTETLRYIKQVSGIYDLEIINFEDLKNADLYKANPSHFIDFINSATIFLTDSFHGVVFSILLETPFIVFRREENGPSMYSRIETLLKTFRLENREVELININDSELMNIDFKDAKKILKSEREKSLTLFSNSFL